MRADKQAELRSRSGIYILNYAVEWDESDMKTILDVLLIDNINKLIYSSSASMNSSIYLHRALVG